MPGDVNNHQLGLVKLPVLYFLDVYWDIWRGEGWVKGKMGSQQFHWTWHNSWGPWAACGQLRLSDSRWSGVLTQFHQSSHKICKLHPWFLKQNMDINLFFFEKNKTKQKKHCVDFDSFKEASLKSFILNFNMSWKKAYKIVILWQITQLCNIGSM